MRTTRVRGAINIVTAFLLVLFVSCVARSAKSQSPKRGSQRGDLQGPGKVRVDSLCGVMTQDVTRNPNTDSIVAWVRIRGHADDDSLTWKLRGNEPIFAGSSYWFIRENGHITHIHQILHHKHCPVEQSA